MKNQGSSTVIALFILILLTTLASGLVLILNKNLLFESKIRNKYLTESELETDLTNIINLFLEDDTPDGNSIFDPVFSYSSSAEINIDDISSKINLNHASSKLFTASNLNKVFQNNKTFQEIEQFINTNGLSFDFENDFKDYFKEDFIYFFSPYSFANINVANNYGLKHLYSIRTDKSSMADFFIQKRDNKIQANNFIKTADLKLFLGIDFDKLFPAVFSEPLFNINLIDENILEYLLSYNGFKIGNNQSNVLSSIIESRKNHELTSEDLKGIINKNENNEIYQYLGTKTWFWNISIKKNNVKLDAILCTIPPVSYGDKDIYQILDKRISE